MMYKILLVDDEAIIALTEARLLEAHGFEVKKVYSGEDAVEAVESDQNISLILMDIDLGEGIDGTEAAQKILEKRDIPIVFLTSHREKEYVERVKELTGYGYVLKNSGEFVLIESINMAFSLHLAKREAQQHLVESENAYQQMEAREVRLQHVNRVLLSIRHVNQIITREHDKQSLLEKTCRTLIETSGYSKAWIILLENGKPVSPYYHSGFKDDFEAMEKFLEEGRIPSCAEEAIARGKTVVTANPEADCSCCPFMHQYEEEGCGFEEHTTLTSPLIHGNTLYGWLSAILPTFHSNNPDEVRLFEEIAEDISYALYTVELNKEKEQVQNALEESEKKYRHLIDNAPVGIFRTVSTGRALHVNPAMAHLVGAASPEEAVYNFQELSTQLYAYPQRRKELLELLEQNGSVEDFVFEAKKIDGIHRRFNMNAHVSERYPNGSFVIDGFISDITEKMEIERISDERRLYLEAILESTPSAILTLDTKNRIKEWNPGAENLFHYTKRETLGKDLDKLVSGNNNSTFRDASDLTQQVSSGEPVLPTNTIRYTKEGTPIDLIVAGSPIIVDGEFKGIVATYTDITPLKKAENEVKSLLAEKEQLLHEVHHRIKNHMNTISSIISLHTNYYQDSRITEVLEEVQAKIKIMQNIYQSLYTGENVNDVKLSDFIDELIGDLELTYIYEKDVRIVSDIEDITVSAKQSLPIGIIINELLTNSLKYAFEDKEQGMIEVKIKRKKDNLIYLSVGDDGTGMPDSIVKEKNYGFGLTLVDGYVTQYKGFLTIDNSEGTAISTELELQHD